MSNSTYLVSARKYRPLLFKDVVAQEHVTETLKNAIRLDRLAHAYMFTGPRGVGKTTAARIVAKAINCTTPVEDREDPSEPCRKCVSCMSFEEGRNMNIIEIDAASNNKVEDVRDLRETVRIPPQNNRMKVYIIDEVHMLSNAAFNALLKTLEEPPPHVMFIFATTEPHKVLPTIQSRCQRFDFRRIATQESVERLRQICETEDISVDEESLLLIARKGDGALRDALSVFDQAVSLCGTTIKYPDLIKALGVVSTDVYFEITHAVLAGKGPDMIRIADRIVRAGYDLQEFVDGLAEHIRNLLVAKTVDDPRLIEASESDRKKLHQHGKDFSESTLLSLIHIVGEISETLRLSRQPRLKLEMALLRMASIPHSVDIKTAIEKLVNLEKMAASGTVRFETVSRPPPNAAVSAPETVPALPPSKAKDESPEPVSNPSPDPISDPRPDPVSNPTAATPAPRKPKPPVATLPEVTVGSQSSNPRTIQEDHAPLFEPPAINRPKIQSDTESRKMETEDVLTLDPDENQADNSDPAELVQLKQAWAILISEVMATEKQLGSFLNHANVMAIESKTVLLGVPDDFHAKALRSERSKLTHRLTDLTGLKIDRIAFRIESYEATKDLNPDSEASVRESLDLLCEKYPVVRTLMERFGGEIVW